MKALKAFLVLSCSFAFCALSFAFAHADYVPGEVLVRFKSSTVGMGASVSSASIENAHIKATSVKALAEKYRVTSFSRIFKQSLMDRPDKTQLLDYYKLTFPQDQSVDEMVKELEKDPHVIQAQPNFIYYALATEPNDPGLSNQWGLTKIQAQNAWDITTGSTNTIVAVLDSGVDYDHLDLSSPIKIIKGIDAINDDDDPMDDQGHGTTVAGVIGAITNNGIGVAGVSWNTRILAVKVLYPTDGGTKAAGDTDDIIEGIEYATGRAHIFNMSFGGTTFGGDDQLVRNALAAAYNAGAVLVAAAGNDGNQIKFYPAAYDNVIAVAATDLTDARSTWGSAGSSNYGTWIHVSAPGTLIYTTKWKNNEYTYASGTSLACPFVAGVAALIKAKYPSATNDEISSMIEDNTDSIDELNPGYAGKLGTGRINAYQALGAIVAQITSPESGDYISGTVEIKGTAGGLGFARYNLGIASTSSFESLVSNSTTSVEAGILATWNTTGKNGNYTIVLTVEGSAPATQEAAVAVIVDNITPIAQIARPLNGATAEGEIAILGTASDTYLNYYILEYGEGDSPPSFERISSSTTEVSNSILGSWVTTGLSGIYTLRLRVLDRAEHSSSESIVLNVAGVAVGTKSTSVVICGPNPFNPSQGDFHFSYNLSANFNTTIYVFDLAGNLLWRQSYLPGENGGKSGPNTPSWSGQDQFGNPVSNGVYLYQVVADHKVIGRGGKILVLR